MRLNIFLEYLGTLKQFIEKNKIMNSQIFSLQWLDNHKFIACGANGLLKLFWFANIGVCNHLRNCIIMRFTTYLI